MSENDASGYDLISVIVMVQNVIYKIFMNFTPRMT